MRIDGVRWTKALSNRISTSCGTNGQQELRWMLQESKIASFRKLGLASHHEYSVSDLKSLLRQVTARSIHRKPLQYILGDVDFLDLSLLCRPPLLIPRPETEHWVHDLAVRLAAHSSPLRILDVGCGSGCIGLALVAQTPNCSVIAVDSNKKALELAVDNRDRNNIPVDRYTVMELQVGAASPALQARELLDLSGGQPFDLVVSNPPYLSCHDWSALQPEIRLWEDPEALVSGLTGFEALSAVIQLASALLGPPKSLELPSVALEFGAGWQIPRLRMELRRFGFERVTVRRDAFGRWRWVEARVPPPSLCD